jgi:hypothetical protein
VGSDYVRSVLDMFAYAREADDALVVGAGLPEAWLAGDGVRVRGLPTPYGDFGFSMQARGDSIAVQLDGGIYTPPGGVVLRPPRAASYVAIVNGLPVAGVPSTEFVVRELPATVTLIPWATPPAPPWRK